MISYFIVAILLLFQELAFYIFILGMVFIFYVMGVCGL